MNEFGEIIEIKDSQAVVKVKEVQPAAIAVHAQWEPIRMKCC
jgi:hypothetical protein